MKFNILTASLCAFIILLAPADGATSISKMIFQIKETYTVTVNDEEYTTLEGAEVYEYRSKMKKAKITNKVILEALVEVGLIEAIQGWSIVYVYNDEEDNYTAVSRGSQLIDISDIIDIEVEIDLENEIGSAAAIKYKHQSTETSESETLVGKGKQAVEISFNFGDDTGGVFAEMCGIYKWSAKTKQINKGGDPYSIIVPRASQITSISGALYEEYADEADTDVEDTDEEDTDEEDSDENSVLEGSIKFQQAKLVRQPL